MAGQSYGEGIDFALVAYREENVWRVEELAPGALNDIEALTGELRRWPGDFGSLGLVSVEEDFFLLVRVAGEHTRLLLSDVTAATEWPIARSALDLLQLPLPDDENDQEPAGDLNIVADLGFEAMDLAALLDDYELFPDEILGHLAHRVGFGELYDELVAVAIG